MIQGPWATEDEGWGNKEKTFLNRGQPLPRGLQELEASSSTQKVLWWLETHVPNDSGSLAKEDEDWGNKVGKEQTQEILEEDMARAVSSERQEDRSQHQESQAMSKEDSGQEEKTFLNRGQPLPRGLQELEASSSTQKVLWWLETHVPNDSGSLAKEDEDWGNKVGKEQTQEILEEDMARAVSSERQEDRSQHQESQAMSKEDSGQEVFQGPEDEKAAARGEGISKLQSTSPALAASTDPKDKAAMCASGAGACLLPSQAPGDTSPSLAATHAPEQTQRHSLFGRALRAEKTFLNRGQPLPRGLQELEASSSTQKVLWWLETHVPNDSRSLAKEDEDWGNKVGKEQTQEILEEDMARAVSSERQEDRSQHQESQAMSKEDSGQEVFQGPEDEKAAARGEGISKLQSTSPLAASTDPKDKAAMCASGAGACLLPSQAPGDTSPSLAATHAPEQTQRHSLFGRALRAEKTFLNRGQPLPRGLQELEASSSTQKVLWWLETHVPNDSRSLATEDEDWGNKVGKEQTQEILEEDMARAVSSERQEDRSQHQESQAMSKEDSGQEVFQGPEDEKAAARGEGISKLQSTSPALAASTDPKDKAAMCASGAGACLLPSQAPGDTSPSLAATHAPEQTQRHSLFGRALRAEKTFLNRGQPLPRGLQELEASSSTQKVLWWLETHVPNDSRSLATEDEGWGNKVGKEQTQEILEEDMARAVSSERQEDRSQHQESQAMSKEDSGQEVFQGPEDEKAAARGEGISKLQSTSPALAASTDPKDKAAMCASGAGACLLPSQAPGDTSPSLAATHAPEQTQRHSLFGRALRAEKTFLNRGQPLPRGLQELEASSSTQKVLWWLETHVPNDSRSLATEDEGWGNKVGKEQTQEILEEDMARAVSSERQEDRSQHQESQAMSKEDSGQEVFQGQEDEKAAARGEGISKLQSTSPALAASTDPKDKAAMCASGAGACLLPSQAPGDTSPSLAATHAPEQTQRHSLFGRALRAEKTFLNRGQPLPRGLQELEASSSTQKVLWWLETHVPNDSRTLATEDEGWGNKVGKEQTQEILEEDMARAVSSERQEDRSQHQESQAMSKEDSGQEEKTFLNRGQPLPRGLQELEASSSTQKVLWWLETHVPNDSRTLATEDEGWGNKVGKEQTQEILEEDMARAVSSERQEDRSQHQESQAMSKEDSGQEEKTFLNRGQPLPRGLQELEASSSTQKVLWWLETHVPNDSRSLATEDEGWGNKVGKEQTQEILEEDMARAVSSERQEDRSQHQESQAMSKEDSGQEEKTFLNRGQPLPRGLQELEASSSTQKVLWWLETHVPNDSRTLATEDEGWGNKVGKEQTQEILEEDMARAVSSERQEDRSQHQESQAMSKEDSGQEEKTFLNRGQPLPRGLQELEASSSTQKVLWWLETHVPNDSRSLATEDEGWGNKVGKEQTQEILEEDMARAVSSERQEDRSQHQESQAMSKEDSGQEVFQGPEDEKAAARGEGISKLQSTSPALAASTDPKDKAAMCASGAGACLLPSQAPGDTSPSLAATHAPEQTQRHSLFGRALRAEKTFLNRGQPLPRGLQELEASSSTQKVLWWLETHVPNDSRTLATEDEGWGNKVGKEQTQEILEEDMARAVSSERQEDRSQHQESQAMSKEDSGQEEKTFLNRGQPLPRGLQELEASSSTQKVLWWLETHVPNDSRTLATEDEGWGNKVGKEQTQEILEEDMARAVSSERQEDRSQHQESQAMSKEDSGQEEKTFLNRGQPLPRGLQELEASSSTQKVLWWLETHVPNDSRTLATEDEGWGNKVGKEQTQEILEEDMARAVSSERQEDRSQHQESQAMSKEDSGQEEKTFLNRGQPLPRGLQELEASSSTQKVLWWLETHVPNDSRTLATEDEGWGNKVGKEQTQEILEEDMARAVSSERQEDRSQHQESQAMSKEDSGQEEKTFLNRGQPLPRGLQELEASSSTQKVLWWLETHVPNDSRTLATEDEGWGNKVGKEQTQEILEEDMARAVSSERQEDRSQHQESQAMSKEDSGQEEKTFLNRGQPLPRGLQELEASSSTQKVLWWLETHVPNDSRTLATEDEGWGNKVGKEQTQEILEEDMARAVSSERQEDRSQHQESQAMSKEDSGQEEKTFLNRGQPLPRGLQELEASSSTQKVLWWLETHVPNDSRTLATEDEGWGNKVGKEQTQEILEEDMARAVSSERQEDRSQHQESQAMSKEDSGQEEKTFLNRGQPLPRGLQELEASSSTQKVLWWLETHVPNDSRTLATEDEGWGNKVGKEQTQEILEEDMARAVSSERQEDRSQHQESQAMSKEDSGQEEKTFLNRGQPLPRGLQELEASSSTQKVLWWLETHVPNDSRTLATEDEGWGNKVGKEQTQEILEEDMARAVSSERQEDRSQHQESQAMSKEDSGQEEKTFLNRGQPLPRGLQELEAFSSTQKVLWWLETHVPNDSGSLAKEDEGWGNKVGKEQTQEILEEDMARAVSSERQEDRSQHQESQAMSKEDSGQEEKTFLNRGQPLPRGLQELEAFSSTQKVLWWLETHVPNDSGSLAKEDEDWGNKVGKEQTQEILEEGHGTCSVLRETGRQKPTPGVPSHVKKRTVAKRCFKGKRMRKAAARGEGISKLQSTSPALAASTDPKDKAAMCASGAGACLLPSQAPGDTSPSLAATHAPEQTQRHSLFGICEK
ncbi:hypothetical protein DUI87_34677 [Hirundo rustica rustica]|uniref:Uncharacterized protein n=1 Tax=Hirundo rustica rustica TaxID=333673 RepID=A0A3M0IR81_HIRRU|nr:hypothetical protein DUI87_34677 [Hirundo rustica rustica]